MFVTFLDCSKAFDKVSHNGLFMKLIERGVPLCFINILAYSLSNLNSRCRWLATFSRSYALLSGVKQGGILSPVLFTVFINDLIIMLRKEGVGCYVRSMFLASIMFADDLALCAPSRHAMQQLIKVCETYCSHYNLTFNTRKTKCMVFGEKFKSMNPSPLILNDEPIHYVHDWKYLGCLVQSGKSFSFSSKNDLCTFRRSANSILRSVKRPNEQVLLRLLYSISIPILTYAADVKRFSWAEMQECHVALNDAIRLIFQYNRWESIRHLRMQFGYHDLFTLFALKRKRFFSNLPRIGNATILSLLYVVTEAQ